MDTIICSWGVKPPSIPASLDGVIEELTTSLIGRLSSAVEAYDTRVTTPEASALVLDGLAASARQLVEHLALPSIPISTEEDSASALRALATPDLLRLQDASADLYDTFVRYDRYFGTRRLPEPDGSQSLLQAARTAELVLDDLHRCIMEGNEVRSILDGLAASFESISGVFTAPDVERQPLVVGTPKIEDEPEAVALRRWRLGHHLFNLLASLAASELIRAREADSEELTVKSISQATRLFRGTTSAMWYAEAFPRNLYRDVVRPSMVEASGKGSGFSGGDNLEFRWFKIAASDLLKALHHRLGAATEWPDEVWMATWTFLETRHLDLEHHTLLAEKVVGREPSLKQLRILEHDAAAGSGVELPAVDSLRALIANVQRDKDSLL